MNIFLFGATGFLGSHVAEQLILGGFQPTCIVRAGSNTQFLQQIHAKVLSFNFDDLTGLKDIIMADSIVINCIADTRTHASYEQKKPVEIDLTKSLFQIASIKKAKRFIQLSTVMVHGFSRPPTSINEEYPTTPSFIYNQIAIDRENTLLSEAKNSNTALIILRPSNVIGKRDTSFLPSFVMAHKFKLFPALDGGNHHFSCIDARDVGRGITHLLSTPVNQPEIFLTKGYDLTWLALKTSLDNYFGRSSFVFNLPKGMTKFFAALFEKLYPYGSSPPLTRFDVAVLSTDTLFDDTKIRTSGFVPKYTIEDSIKSTIE